LGEKFSDEEFKELTEGSRSYETGYRSWGLKFHGPERVPRLFPKVISKGPWEPGEGGEIVSSYKPDRKDPFEQSSEGLYSKRSLKNLRLESGYADKGDIVGSIIPYGDIVHGDEGFRSTKAKVKALYTGTSTCSLCGKPAKYVVRSNGDAVLLCKTCRNRLSRLIGKLGTRGEEYTLEELLGKLGEIYSAEVLDFPEEGWV